jgi:hypothetical protein
MRVSGQLHNAAALQPPSPSGERISVPVEQEAGWDPTVGLAALEKSLLSLIEFESRIIHPVA